MIFSIVFSCPFLPVENRTDIIISVILKDIISNQKQKIIITAQVYILTGGNSFSATTLFASSLVKQDNVTVVGEETGGGAYGNSAWLIPDVTLPNTGVRFRLPLFRLVIDKDTPKVGKGVQPEVESKPSIDAIKRGIDYKLEKAMELIKKDKESRRPPGLIQ